MPVSAAASLTIFTPYGPTTASTRVRVHGWLPYVTSPVRVLDYAGLSSHSPGQLARHPTAVMTAEWHTRWIARTAFDRVLVHREISPFSSGGLAEQAMARSRLAVYDFDDAIMWTDDLRTNRRLSPGGLARAVWSKAAACRRSVVAADRVIAGSAVLAEWAAQHNRDVRLIPSCIEPDDYRAKDVYACGETPRLVWLGSPATEYNLTQIAAPLLRAHEASGARLTVISAGDADLGPLAAITDRVAWYPGVEATLGWYDLGIMPLTDDRYERGKCAYKILQYAAAGLPVVASPVGANAQALAVLGQAAATTDDQWVEAVVDTVTASAADRAARGATARAAVVEHFSYPAWADRWRAAVDEVG